MLRLLRPIRTLLGRWSRQQETVIRQMAERRTAGEGLAAIAESRRIHANFKRSGLAAFVPLLLSDLMDWPRGPIWHGWFWISASWAAIVVGIGLAAYWRGLWGPSDRDR